MRQCRGCRCHEFKDLASPLWSLFDYGSYFAFEFSVYDICYYNHTPYIRKPVSEWTPLSEFDFVLLLQLTSYEEMRDACARYFP